MKYNYTMPNDITPSFFVAYMDLVETPYHIDGTIVEGVRNVSIMTTQELTGTEHIAMTEYINNYSDFNQTIVNEGTLEVTKKWGRAMVDEFELKNMKRKNNGEMGRIELKNIMKETHDSMVYISMVEGSLDTLLGIFTGFPEETVEGTTYPEEAAFTFAYVWAEDLAWIQSSLYAIIQEL